MQLPVRSVRLVLSFACILLLCGLITGCGRSMGTVTGKVTFKDQSLKGGTVGFIGTDGQQSATATINEDGTYEIPQVQAGTYQVIVDTQSLKPKQSGNIPSGPKGTSSNSPDPKTMGAPPGAVLPDGYKTMSPVEAEAAQKANLKRYIAIPADYADPAKSGLTITVTGGSQVYNIELK